MVYGYIGRLLADREHAIDLFVIDCLGGRRDSPGTIPAVHRDFVAGCGGLLQRIPRQPPLEPPSSDVDSGVDKDDRPHSVRHNASRAVDRGLRHPYAIRGVMFDRAVALAAARGLRALARFPIDLPQAV